MKAPALGLADSAQWQADEMAYQDGMLVFRRSGPSKELSSRAWINPGRSRSQQRFLISPHA